MSFCRNTTRKARKEHKCTLCHKTIKIGEEYITHADNIIDSYTVYTSKECLICQPILKEFELSGYSDDGYNEETIREWWQEEKCPKCIHRWLPCKPSWDCFGELVMPEDMCPQHTKDGTCQASDCNNMSHYCRCENFETDEPKE